MRRSTILKLALAAGWGLAGAALWAWASARPWVAPAPFDIIGFLWLLTNLPRLFVSGVALLCVVPAVYCVLWALRDRG
jgi:hypothetical protein